MIMLSESEGEGVGGRGRKRVVVVFLGKIVVSGPNGCKQNAFWQLFLTCLVEF